MAITATFTADFTKWNQGLRDAQTGLKPIEVSAKGLQAQLERTAKSFSGVNLKREAEVAAAAVKSIGGAVKLTNDELKAYARTVDAAMAKSRRLGEGISPALKEARRDIDAAKKSLGGFTEAGAGIKSAFSGVGAAIAGAFAVGTFVSAAKAAIDYAGSIKDLSAQTGFGVEALQELKFAADQNGTSIDAVATAAFNLQKKIGEGSTGTVGALNKLGLSMDALKQLKPEDQFKAVANALGQVQDQNERVKRGTELLGKGYKDVSALINDGLQKNIDKAREWGVVLSGEQIDKLDDLGDAMAALQLKGKVLLAEVLIPMAPALIAAANAGIGFGGWLKEAQDYFTTAIVGGYRFTAMINNLAADILQFNQNTNPFAWISGSFQKEIDRIRQVAKDADYQAGSVMADLQRSNAPKPAKLGNLAGPVNDAKGAVAGLSAQLKQAQIDLLEYGKKHNLAELRKNIEAGTFDMEQLKDETGLSELALKLFQKQITATNKAFRESDATKLSKAVADLEKDLRAAEAAGLPAARVLERYGSTIRTVAEDAAGAQRALPDMIAKWSAALASSDIDKALASLAKLTTDLANGPGGDVTVFQARMAENQKGVDRMVADTDAAFDAMRKAHDAYQDAVAQRTMTATEFQIRELEKARDAEIAALHSTGPIRAQAEAEIKKYYADRIDLAMHAGLAEAHANRLALKDQLLTAQQTYRDITADAKFSGAERERAEQHLRDVVAVIQQQFGKDWKAVLESMGIDWKQFVDFVEHNAIGKGVLKGLEKAAQNIPDILIQGMLHGASLEEVGSALGTEIGADVGEGIGNAIAPGIGGAIGRSVGALLGPLLAKLIKTDSERAVAEIGKEWGVTISDSMGDTIEKTMKSRFEGLRNNRWLAEVWHLGDIVADIGGITVKNLPDLQTQLRQAFVFLTEGAFDVADVQHVLDTSFNEFTEFFTSRDALISNELIEIIRLDKQLGVHSKAVADFVQGQATRAAGGFNKIASNFLALVTGFKTGSKDIQELLKGIDDAIADPKKRGNFAPEFLADVEKQLGRVGPLVQAAFGSLLAGGATVSEALAQLAPGLSEIQKILTATGQHADGFLGDILGWEKVVAQNKELFDALSGVDDMLAGLHNSGLLTQEAFGALASTITDAFATLTGQGTSATDAIMLMQPQLQKVWELQQDFGYAVDDATQALLDQAEAAGQVGDKHRSVQDQMLLATNRVADAAEYLAQVFGYVIPSALGDTSEASGNTSDDLIQDAKDAERQWQEFQDGLPDDIKIPASIDIAQPKIPHIPDVHIRGKIDVERPEPPGGGGRPGGDRQYATGTPDLAFVNFGHRTPADLHGWEAVVPFNRRHEAVAKWGFGSGPAVIASPAIDYTRLAEAFLAALHRSGLTSLGSGVGQRDALDRILPQYIPDAMSRFGAMTRQIQNTLGIR